MKFPYLRNCKRCRDIFHGGKHSKICDNCDTRFKCTKSYISRKPSLFTDCLPISTNLVDSQ